MQLSDLRYWHWIVIGALLGLLIGYSLNAVGPDAILAGAKSRKTSQEIFEGELVKKAKLGKDGKPAPFIANLVVYPDGPIDLLRFDRLIIKDPRTPNGEYEQWFYEAHRPYSPLDQWDMRTDVRVKPGFPADGYHPDENWQQADGAGTTSRDPGPGPEGCTLQVFVAKGNYDVVVNVDNAQQAADLSLKFNDHVLPPLTADPKDANYFHTSVPAADFDTDKPPELWLSRKDAPVHIHQIHVYNPTYTVRDYLNELAAQKNTDGTPVHPQIAYRYGWWVEPRAILWMAVGGSVLVVGIIWPTVLSLLVGAGFGPVPREKGVSLRNLKATAAPGAGATPPTDAELAAVAQMGVDLEKSLEADAAGRRATTPSAPGSLPPIPALNAKAVEPPPFKGPKKPEAPKTFAGEYYPVARKSEEKKDGG